MPNITHDEMKRRVVLAKQAYARALDDPSVDNRLAYLYAQNSVLTGHVAQMAERLWKLEQELKSLREQPAAAAAPMAVTPGVAVAGAALPVAPGPVEGHSVGEDTVGGETALGGSAFDGRGLGETTLGGSFGAPLPDASVEE